MNARRRIPALLAFAALAVLASPTLAGEAFTPSAAVAAMEPPLVVTPRDDDVSINQGVIDALAADPRIAGIVGVETRDRDVELSGIVATDGQALRAGRVAGGVYGVRNVRSGLTTRVGPHTR